MTTKTIQKIQIYIYKYTWLLCLIILPFLLYTLNNVLEATLTFLTPWFQNFAIMDKIKEFLYYSYITYYLLKPLLTSSLDALTIVLKLITIGIKYCICAIYLIIYFIKQHFFFLLAAGKHEYGFIWGGALTNIEFASTFIKNCVYVFCDGITILVLQLVRAEILGLTLLVILITSPYYIIKYVINLWLSLHINISLFTLLFIIIPFGIRVYYDLWKTYWIDLQQNAEIYTYEYYGYYDYHEDNDTADYLDKVFYPFIFFKIFSYIYIYIYTLYKISWNIVFLSKIWYYMVIINGFLLIASITFILFIIYLSLYNLAYKHFIEFPIVALRKKWDT